MSQQTTGTDNWRPTADIDTLRQRAALLSRLRRFFDQRGVLEVDTPSLSHAAVTDIHLHSFATELLGAGCNAGSGSPLYLQTSPEFPMKRLLAAGSGPIYQLCKVFRNEESGRHHNPEFTMLEWYRPGFDHHALMDEMDQLLQALLACETAERMTYQQAMVTHLGVDPLLDSLSVLKQAAAGLGLEDITRHESDRDTLLQLLFALGVEPKIGQLNRPAFVFNFPASQAALARISPEDSRVAERFEVYFKGIELANGFHELSDGAEQLRRFEQDNRRRAQAGRPQAPIDHRLIAALDSGFPDCAGVALGIDRLVMLALGKNHIAQVIAFSTPAA